MIQQASRNKNRLHRGLLALFVVIGAAGDGLVNRAWAMPPIEGEPIEYGSRELHDPISLLQKKIDGGEVTLDFDEDHGYLPSVLDQLDVPVSSQVLVFSKTSFQRPRISAKWPRAIYFSEDVYIGWVQRGRVVEVSSVDPEQGAIFYSLEQTKSDAPRFTRHTDRCLLCHSSSQTKSVPGHLVRSVYPDAGGFPMLASGTFRTDHRSPLKERWGGWYVTGTHGSQTHMGNVYVRDKSDAENLDREAGANITDLSDRFDTSPYMSAHSDIVALMVMEHQTQMHNLITHANYQGRFALRDEAVINKMLERPADHRSPSTRRRFDSAAHRLVKYMLFVDEARLTDPVRGTSGFARQFAQQGLRDGRGRSLREFDLESRLFKYPCSYLIHSAAFEKLPEPVKASVYRRLWEVLTGQFNDEDGDYSHLSETDRRAILEILGETKTGLPEYWNEGATGQ